MTLYEILIFFVLGFISVLTLTFFIAYISYKLKNNDNYSDTKSNNYPIKHSFNTKYNQRINSTKNFLENNNTHNNYRPSNFNYSTPSYNKYYIYHKKLTE